MTHRQPGKLRAVSVVAVLVGASRMVHSPPWTLIAVLVVVPATIVGALILVTAIFGNTRTSNRSFRLISFLLRRSASKL
jgi:hypothetical protein